MFQEERLAAAAGCLVPLSTIIEETIAYTKVFLSFSSQPVFQKRHQGFARWTGALKPKYLQRKSFTTIHAHLDSGNFPFQERRAFGAPLLENQYIHFRLAELHTEVKN